MTTQNLADLPISPGRLTALNRFSASLQQLLKDNLVSISLYGSILRSDFISGRSDLNLLVITRKLTLEDLKTVCDECSTAKSLGLSPFFMTREDLETSADVFPIKFMAMQERRRVVFGADVLADIRIQPTYVRLRCEQEIKNLLLRLRTSYLRQEGHDLIAIMWALGTSLRETLRLALSLTPDGLLEREEVIVRAAARFGFNAEPVLLVLAFRERECDLTTEEAERLYGELMEAVTIMARAIDKLSPETRG